MKQLSIVEYDAHKYSDDNLLYRHGLIDPVELQMNFTYLYGKDSDMFPLLSTTEGEGLIKSVSTKSANDTTFTWKVYGRMKHVSPVHMLVSPPVSGAVGANFMPFEVDFKDGLFIKQHSLTSPDGSYQVRVQAELGKQANGMFRYRLTIKASDATTAIPVAQFAAGKYWVMGASSVPMSKSDGNRSNSMVPGEWMGQFGAHRYSMHLAGNVSNKVLNVQLPMDNGKSTNMWMPYDMKVFELDRRLKNESALWYDEFNRDENGMITLMDEETDEPIPQGAGVKQVLTEIGNYSTYSTLTVDTIDATINAVLSNRVDQTPSEIVLYTGDGGIRQFDMALKNASTNYYEALGDKVIGDGANGYLTYGAYYKAYKTIDGKIIKVVNTNLFNHGLRAEMQRANGELIDGFPLESYNLVSLDQSRTDDGSRNISLISEKGREYLTGVYKGMSPLPEVWGKIPTGGLLSTTKDIASYETFDTQGLVFTNPTTSFWLSRSL